MARGERKLYLSFHFDVKVQVKMQDLCDCVCLFLCQESFMDDKLSCLTLQERTLVILPYSGRRAGENGSLWCVFIFFGVIFFLRKASKVV